MNNSYIVRQMWDEISEEYLKNIYTEKRIKELLDRPESVFPKQTFLQIKKCLGEFTDKKICILGSGDNLAGFALARLGAAVTSVDISQKQLSGAKKCSDLLGITNIEYLCDDIMKLSTMEQREFDLILTTNGTLNFISDLSGMFAQVRQRLKTGGHYILFDTHPFMRPFAGYLDKLVIEKPYDRIGPFTQVFAYHWRIQDYMNAFCEHQLLICDVQEFCASEGFFWNEFVKKSFDASVYDWHRNPLAALPQYIVITGKKLQDSELLF